MALHAHTFVENYQGMVGFGMDRETDENTVIYYLQKFSDDALLDVLRRRMEDKDLEALFELMSVLLRKHLSEEEYHALFLKEDHP
ncbi:cytoplasmic protein [Desulfatitalea alkaliphila]|uniref:Cytoplasmic protein n=1 Tax=Desulfatitalea alkaliphila TaxID=2929485 RepID=A0AA41R2N4_9BACT|nr:cytoplasmic protein [Desulfatitalea alkaliphila]MCJ8501724.1 cytoplasmic protein [Desulfatitalea alkaliphila]